MRSLDILLSTLILIMFSPILLLISLLIFLEDKNPIIFKQERMGKNLKSFEIYKFRSMKDTPSLKKIENRETISSKKNDKRVTKVGKIIRKYSLDELPQLVNVLKGDMSLVGPRPDTLYQDKDYTKEQWKLRHTIRPGITGLSQIKGRSNLNFENRIKYDIYLAENLHLALYIKILFKTIPVVLLKKNTN